MAKGLIFGHSGSIVTVSIAMVVAASQMVSDFRVRAASRWRNVLHILNAFLVVVLGLMAFFSAVSYWAGPWILLASGAVASYVVLRLVRHSDVTVDREAGEV